MSAFVQSKTAQGGSSNTIIAAFDADVVAGRLIIVAIASNFASPHNTVTDNLGNTYTKVFEHNSFNEGTLSVWYAKQIIGGSCTITATVDSSGGATALVIHEYDITIADPFDQFAVVGGAGANPDSGNIVTTDDELLFGALGTGAFEDIAVISIVPGSGWTQREEEEDGTTTFASFNTADKEKVAGTYNALWTLNPDTGWVASITAFFGVTIPLDSSIQHERTILHKLDEPLLHSRKIIETRFSQSILHERNVLSLLIGIRHQRRVLPGDLIDLFDEDIQKPTADITVTL